MAVHVCNTVLILRIWNSRLIRTILAGSGEYYGKILSRTGFNQVTGLIHPRDAITSARVMDVANRLSAVKRLDAQTLWARLKALGRKRKTPGDILQAVFAADRSHTASNRVVTSIQLM